jgi:hypothetical protein
MKFVEAKELEQMSASEANRVLIELQSRVIVLEKQMGDVNELREKEVREPNCC